LIEIEPNFMILLLLLLLLYTQMLSWVATCRRTWPSWTVKSCGSSPTFNQSACSRHLWRRCPVSPWPRRLTTKSSTRYVRLPGSSSLLLC